MGAATQRKVDLMGEAKINWWIEHLKAYPVVVAVAEEGGGAAGEKGEGIVKNTNWEHVDIII